jgi:UDP-N-acetylmuramate-alanine ligase
MTPAASVDDRGGLDRVRAFGSDGSSRRRCRLTLRASPLAPTSGWPGAQFPTITVGGTNGKGSTCAFLETILREAGYAPASSPPRTSSTTTSACASSGETPRTG